jgi:hypothetical protein
LIEPHSFLKNTQGPFAPLAIVPQNIQVESFKYLYYRFSS